MKLHILSDIHNEFEKYEPLPSDADAIILAGDIDTKGRAINWAKKAFPDTHVIYVLGNHEYYNSSTPKILKKMKNSAAGSYVHILENTHVCIDNIHFLGCTLWTDFKLFGDPTDATYKARTSMSDYKKIRVDPKYRRLTPMDTISIHNKSVFWLKEKIKELKNETIIVVTHHAPSMKSVHEDDKCDILSAAYASNLDHIVAKSNAKLWIHGHMHTSLDYKIGNTRMICNPRGYPKQENTGFNAELVIEI